MIRMTKHQVTCTDEDVRLRGGYGTSRGTVARCECGWVSSWWVRDGSAEADADMHMRAFDAEYNARRKAEEARWEQERIERETQRQAELEEFWKTEPLGPKRKPRERCHDCTCFINPPCDACVDCNHYDLPVDFCENECGECEEEHHD